LNSIHIVVADGYALNPGDLSWAALEEIGPCHVYDRTPQSLLVERAREAAVLLINKAVISREVLDALPGLRYIGVLATGYNGIDTIAAGEAGVVVTNVPEYGTASVAQMVFAHLLHHTQSVARHTASVQNGRWTAAPDWCYWETPLLEIQGLTMGIVGYGRIGRRVGAIAHSFGMNVIAADPAGSGEFEGGAAEMVELDAVFRRADVVSLHCPLTPGTRKIVNAKRLLSMKPGAFLINTSRGGLVDSRALCDALESGRLAGAGLDVLEMEPPPENDPLLHAPNCSLTPHIAWATIAARRRLLEIAVGNLHAWLRGHPRNVVA
jgi:glycerate dehydrogenase